MNTKKNTRFMQKNLHNTKVCTFIKRSILQEHNKKKIVSALQVTGFLSPLKQKISGKYTNSPQIEVNKR